jgi:hypothetical protein
MYGQRALTDFRHTFVGSKVAVVIALPFICAEYIAANRYVFHEKVISGAPVRVVTDPPTHFAGITGNDAEKSGTVIHIRATALPLIGPSARGISRLGVVGAFPPFLV